jgi:hypothetical protein
MLPGGKQSDPVTWAMGLGCDFGINRRQIFYSILNLARQLRNQHKLNKVFIAEDLKSNMESNMESMTFQQKIFKNGQTN